MAQLAEQLICNQQVIGSSPIIGFLLWEEFNIAGWSSLEARRAHNPKVVGSNPAPATQDVKSYAQIAQLVEQRTENPRVAGSIPALGIFVAKSNEIIEYGRVAQLVEHLTFNQVVRGSNPRTLIVEQAILLVLFVILTYILITPMLCKRFSTDIICEKVWNMLEYLFESEIDVDNI